MSNQGEAAAVANRFVPAADGVPDHNEQDVVIWNGYYDETIPMPTEWFPASSPPAILSLSDDGNALVLRPVTNPDASIRNEYYLLNTYNGSFTLVKQPGLENETIVSVSTHKERTLGNGPKPFQTTPDNICLQLGELAIRSNSTLPAVTLSSLYPNTFVPQHITSDGRITLTTTDGNNQSIIIQIIPHNDVDTDGMADDWEKSFAENLLDLGKTPADWGTYYAELVSGNLDSITDYTGDGITAGDIAKLASDPAGTQATGGITEEFQDKRNILAWGFMFPQKAIFLSDTMAHT